MTLCAQDYGHNKKADQSCLLVIYYVYSMTNLSKKIMTDCNLVHFFFKTFGVHSECFLLSRSVDSNSNAGPCERLE